MDSLTWEPEAPTVLASRPIPAASMTAIFLRLAIMMPFSEA